MKITGDYTKKPSTIITLVENPGANGCDPFEQAGKNSHFIAAGSIPYGVEPRVVQTEASTGLHDIIIP